MFEVGRVCVKIAGRDAALKCVIIDVLDQNYVLVDGQTRRKQVNIKHLEPLPQKVDVSKNASHDVVVQALATINVAVDKKGEKKTAKQKPMRKRKSLLKAQQKVKKPVAEKKEKKSAKKAAQ